ncbi:transcription antitermination factor NusB [Candidatus Saccharibacteria bacterium TM7i]|nr:transcription antitermination factor NusB [Candidatus Saccharibacteria bacterium TM7i]
MASNRHLGRIVALQTLYEYEFRTQSNDTSADVKGILHRNLERYEEAIGDISFVEAIVEGVLKEQDALDGTIQPVAPDWPIEQIARVDRAILRIGVFELLHRGDVVPPKVAINEAVELAKAFGSDNSSKFVNGVLGTVYRNTTGDAEGAGNGNATVR